MYLLPTSEELAGLYSQIDPKQRFLQTAREAINTLTEDVIMPYFDDIEDDIISMRRDVNGFRIHIPASRYIEYVRGRDTVNFKGWTFEHPKAPDPELDLKILESLPNNQFVDSWDDI